MRSASMGGGCRLVLALARCASLDAPIDEAVIKARCGGDEFSVILPEVDRIGAVRVAERIRQRVGELRIRNPFSAISQSLTLSIGGWVTALDRNGSAERLVALADAELYRAKRGGRNRTSVAQAEAGAVAFGRRGAADPPTSRAPAASS